jgi:hypothetical protein
MSSSNPTLDWERCGDSFYRKTKVYDALFDQDLELENYVIAAAPFGGAIGILSHKFRRLYHISDSL